MDYSKKSRFVYLMFFLILWLGLSISYGSDSQTWPQTVKEIKYLTSADDSMQPSLFYSPKNKEATPLLVVLHTWGGDYTQTHSIPFAQWCIEKQWAFVHPNFRGPNKSKESTCSELVIRDIISAVDYAKANADVDIDCIYLVGWSGGGCASLMVAGRFPDIWAGVSVWVPVTDLRAWYLECKANGSSYADNIETSCGGVPGESLAIDFEYMSRSPLTFIENMTDIPLDINAGINDDVIPISHSLNAFNLLAQEKDRISPKDIDCFVKEKSVPLHIKEPVVDSLYGDNTPLFRKSSGNARITVFDGGHDRIPYAALTWLAEQKKN